MKQSLNLVCYFACVGVGAGVGMLNVPIHKPHRQKNYRSSTGKSTGGETLQLDVLRAVQTHIFRLLQTQKTGWQSCPYCILANKTKMNGLSGTQTGELAWE